MKIATSHLTVLCVAVDAAIESLPADSVGRLDAWMSAPAEKKQEAYEAAKADPLASAVLRLYRLIGEESWK